MEKDLHDLITWRLWELNFQLYERLYRNPRILFFLYLNNKKVYDENIREAYYIIISHYIYNALKKWFRKLLLVN